MMTNGQIISVFADASASTHTGAGGYAYWARSAGDQRVKGSSGWRGNNISEIETIALCTGLMAALDELPCKPGVTVVLQSDSLDALGGIYGLPYGHIARTSDCRISPRRARGTAMLFIEKAVEQAREISALVYLKHVKAHTGSSAGRSQVNQWCDEQAKAARKQMERCMTLKKRLPNEYQVEAVQ